MTEQIKMDKTKPHRIVVKIIINVKVITVAEALREIFKTGPITELVKY